MGRMTEKQIKDMSRQLSDICGNPTAGVEAVDFLTRSLGRVLGELSETQRENRHLDQMLKFATGQLPKAA